MMHGSAYYYLVNRELLLRIPRDRRLQTEVSLPALPPTVIPEEFLHGGRRLIIVNDLTFDEVSKM
jgi:hypothetical protein